VDSLPVITIGDADRFLADRVYRNRCVDRILEILLDIETWMGAGGVTTSLKPRGGED
jgi:hypothetical protein